ncbi:hypothetical protein FKM82_020636 [Ascaphus truei]
MLNICSFTMCKALTKYMSMKNYLGLENHNVFCKQSPVKFSYRCSQPYNTRGRGGNAMVLAEGADAMAILFNVTACSVHPSEPQSRHSELYGWLNLCQ